MLPLDHRLFLSLTLAVALLCLHCTSLAIESRILQSFFPFVSLETARCFASTFSDVKWPFIDQPLDDLIQLLFTNP